MYTNMDTLLETVKDVQIIKDVFAGSLAELKMEVKRQNLIVTNYKITSTDGKTLIVKSGDQQEVNKDTDVLTAVLDREVLAREFLSTIAPDLILTPKILGRDTAKILLIEEDCPGYEDLQDRVLLDNEVDHALACNVARILAKIHKTTHTNILAPERFKEMCDNFRHDTVINQAKDLFFVESFRSNNLREDLDLALRQSAIHYLDSQEFTNILDRNKDYFENNKECLMNVNTKRLDILTKDDNALLDCLCFMTVGPGSFDLARLVACYVTGHYFHMLTEDNNDFHSKISHQLYAAIQKMFEAYFDEGTPNTCTDGGRQARFVSSVAGFAGLDLIKMALTQNFGVCISNSLRREMFSSGQRLLNGQQRIDTAGRLLMIGLQLC